MSEWKEERLEDIIDVNPTVKLKKGQPYPFIDIDKISPVYRSVTNEEIKTYEGQSSSKFCDGDTVFSRITPCLENRKIAMVSINENAAFGSTEFFVFRAKENKADARFTYYLTSSDIVVLPAINSMTGASGRQRADKRFIQRIKLCIPDLPTQERIADILSAYDDLIENNNKRIKLLEKMAENLYKEWFVRFRFPNFKQYKTKDSSLGKIPECFNVVKINTLIDYYIGGGWGSDNPNDQFCEEAYVVRGTDFPHFKSGKLDTCPLRYHKTSNFNARVIRENDIVLEVSGGTQDQPVGRSILITKKQLNRLHNRLICASFCKQIRCNFDKISPRYLYHWLQYMYETRMIDKFQLQSTGIINFKFEYFMRKCDVILPPFEIMKQFDLIVEPLYTEIDIIAQQNENLIKQRDFLLPRLMSGKLEVE